MIPAEQRVLQKPLFHPAVRVTLYLLSIALLSLLLSVPLLLLRPSFAGTVISGGTLGSLDYLAAGATTIASGLLATWLFRVKLDRRSLLSLGFERGAHRLRETAIGFALGALLMCGVLLSELLLGGYRLRNLDLSSEALLRSLPLLAIAFLAYTLVALNEEIVARGYILQNFELCWGTRAATVVSSILFALAHLANPGATPLAIVGIFMAGLLLALGYLITRALWLPIGLHLSWNFVQGPLFGFPVSGTLSGSLLTLEPIGPEFLTGGSFGPEASIVGILASTMGILTLKAAAARQWVRVREEI